MSDQVGTEQPRVLIVEDDDQLRLALKRYMKRNGFDVVLATDGLSALKELIEGDFDAIVTDYKMDVLGGAYWVRFLEKFYRETPIIVTSGFLKPEIPIPFTVLLKPFDLADLVSTLREQLSAE